MYFIKSKLFSDSRMVFIIVLMELLMGCSLFSSRSEQKSPSQTDSRREKNFFESGLKFLESENYFSAINEFDQLLNQYPNSSYYLVSLYNKGSALEGMGRCQDAAIVYRQVIAQGEQKSPQLGAQSLYRLSFVYECLGDAPKQIASLLDSLRRKTYFSSQVTQAEIPARLAAAYAQQGDFSSAKKYFDRAQFGLKEFYHRSENSVQKRDMMARVLYFMGQIKPHNEVLMKQPLAYLRSLNYLQGYLLKSAEMKSAQWSPQAANNLINAYQSIWIFLNRDTLQSQEENESEPQIFQFKQKQNELTLEAFTNIQTLKNMRFPDYQEGVEVKKIFNEIDLLEKRLNEYRMLLAEEKELTNSAKKREGLKREGRVRSKPTVLESKTREKERVKE